MRTREKRWCRVGGAIAVVWSLSMAPVQAIAPSAQAAVSDLSEPEREENYIRPSVVCTDELKTLADLLLRDLPSYANRVNQRSLGRERANDRPGTIIVAEQAEFEPLSLGPGTYEPTDSLPEGVSQVFFTTLERQYIDREPITIQHHHWLFITQSDDRGWLLVTLLSQLANVPEGQPISPPQENSQGVIAQATRLWLRDCRTMDVFPAE